MASQKKWKTCQIVFCSRIKPFGVQNFDSFSFSLTSSTKRCLCEGHGGRIMQGSISRPCAWTAIQGLLHEPAELEGNFLWKCFPMTARVFHFSGQRLSVLGRCAAPITETKISNQSAAHLTLLMQSTLKYFFLGNQVRGFSCVDWSTAYVGEVELPIRLVILFFIQKLQWLQLCQHSVAFWLSVAAVLCGHDQRTIRDGVEDKWSWVKDKKSWGWAGRVQGWSTARCKLWGQLSHFIRVGSSLAFGFEAAVFPIVYIQIGRVFASWRQKCFWSLARFVHEDIPKDVNSNFLFFPKSRRNTRRKEQQFVSWKRRQPPVQEQQAKVGGFLTKLCIKRWLFFHLWLILWTNVREIKNRH